MPWRADHIIAAVPMILPAITQLRHLYCRRHTGPTATLVTEHLGYVTAHDEHGHTTGCAVQNTVLRWTVYNRAGDVLGEDVTTLGAMAMLRGISDPQAI